MSGAPGADPIIEAYRLGVEEALIHLTEIIDAFTGRRRCTWDLRSPLAGDERTFRTSIAGEDRDGHTHWTVDVETVPIWRVYVTDHEVAQRRNVRGDNVQADTALEAKEVFCRDFVRLGPEDVTARPVERLAVAAAVAPERVEWLETIAAENECGLRSVPALLSHIISALTDGARRTGCWERGPLNQLVGEPDKGWGLPEEGELARFYRRPLPRTTDEAS